MRNASKCFSSSLMLRARGEKYENFNESFLRSEFLNSQSLSRKSFKSCIKILCVKTFTQESFFLLAKPFGNYRDEKGKVKSFFISTLVNRIFMLRVYELQKSFRNYKMKKKISFTCRVPLKIEKVKWKFR